jgi:glycosyltransferase involved in cell wall biosynthesis
MHADVVCLSHLRWGFVFQRPNHLMSRCAKNRRVFFVEEPIYDADEPMVAYDEVAPNLTVVVPHLPESASPASTSPSKSLELQRVLLDAVMRDHRIHRPLLWYYTPMALAFSSHHEASAVVYDCMDELSNFAGAPPELRERERELFRRADLVFTGGHSLYEAKRAQHESVHAFPSSVEVDHFQKARTGNVEEPADQKNIPGPRLGFYGVIDERIDRDLLAALADAEPSWQIVIVGPVVKIDPKSLPQRNNIHYLGQKSYAELPSYLAGWDVAIMPFAQNDATRFISPTKTLEYLAAGKPVVSTPIRDVVRPYAELGIARVGSGKDFIHEVREALRERGSDAEAARMRVADERLAATSWDLTWDAMDALIRGVANRAQVA